MAPVSPAEGPKSYEGVYDRPAPGEYTVSVMVNDSHCLGSPFKITSVDSTYKYEPHRHTVRIPQPKIPANEEQSISV